jgi:hypothetical protein
MNNSSVKPQTVMVNNMTSHNNMNNSSVKPQTVMVNKTTSHNNTNHFSVKPQTVIGQQYSQPQQYDILLSHP